jgi:hypothetical protein
MITEQLFYVLLRDIKTKEVVIASYYSGFSVFKYKMLAQRRIKTLKRYMADTHEFRILPWHSEMGEVNLEEMWRSALEYINE